MGLPSDLVCSAPDTNRSRHGEYIRSLPPPSALFSSLVCSQCGAVTCLCDRRGQACKRLAARANTGVGSMVHRVLARIAWQLRRLALVSVLGLAIAGAGGDCAGAQAGVDL